MTASIYISKVLTVIKQVSKHQHSVVVCKLGSLANVLEGVTSFEFQGLAKPSKMDKYKKVIEGLEFLLESEHCVNADFEDKETCDYILKYKK